eukprot:CAMPEP_0118929646 /NCGR_PEP_ID=MMETSP1169-20130426/6589_1 /TAXON_ID=36882 /ORGANISM="Pyramimonas obovata, Strain CCMP722" /LENGTH=324 /DNA_ID=CAMNT_0006871879 /DNA_START=52 /DNA_END=1026 /DNA_ORIENTATION=+
MPPAKPSTVKYVLIPADASQPMEELEVEQPEGKEVECLTNWMQEYYRKQGRVASEEGKAAFRKQLSEKMPADMITEEMLSGAYGMQLVESVPLMSGGPHSDWEHVNLYCDDKGQMKCLPLNARAMGLADAAGKPSQVYGDCFVGRVYETADDFHRLHFTMQECDSTAAWINKAKDHNLKKAHDSSGMRTMQDLANASGTQVFDTSNMQRVQVVDDPMADAADPGDTPGAFTWTQSQTEVVVAVGCPKGTKSNQIKCKIRPNNLSLAITGIPEPTVFDDVLLFAKVDPEESTWSIEDQGEKRILSITLTKENKMRWLDLKTALAK